jgi:hypothetical protein
MRFEALSFGSIQIDDVIYDHDIVIDRGEIRKRKKKASKKFREEYGHTPDYVNSGKSDSPVLTTVGIPVIYPVRRTGYNGNSNRSNLT